MPAPAPSSATVILRDAATGRWLLFDRPLDIVQTADPAEVLPCLRRIEAAVDARGLHAAGVLAYEAAPAFDPALRTALPDRTLPLLWFGLFAPPRETVLPPPAAAQPAGWQPSLPPESYRAAFSRIKHHIREGDAYQVNLTYRLRSAICGPRSVARDPTSDLRPPASGLLSLFSRLVSAQQATYGAFVSTPLWTLCSASPELFFSLDGDRLESRPMKGTAPRGLTPDEDRARADALRASEKNRAENLMIVDMVRNDLGRIANPGSVSVPDLFTLEKYPSVWQMTSTVRAETGAGIAEIFAALFPAASITGAPKSAAMRIIAETECGPRRFYTGSAGFLAPGRRAQFNVAIRSLLIDAASGQAEFGTGGGVVWDSECGPEQAESLTKALILSAPAEPFSLLETMLWTPGEGVYLEREHLARLAGSAEYFDIPADLDEIRSRLARLSETLPAEPHRVRLLVAQNGAVTVEAAPFAPAPPEAPPLRVALAPAPVDKGSPFLYHKTTRRSVYDEALAACPGFDDALLWNAEGEATESTRANLAAEVGGALCTPPVRCGLLPGTLRQRLLETGQLTERVLTLDDLRRAPRVFLFNSLRGLMPAQICFGK